MASQEGAQGRKILRVDDPTEDENRGVMPPGKPSTRTLVGEQNPGMGAAGSSDPDADARQKYAASYAAMKDAQHRAVEELQQQQQQQEEVAVVNPTSPQPVRAPVLPQQLQSDLSLLVTTGQIRDEIVVGGFKFALRTLMAKENNEVLRVVGTAADELEKLGALRIAVLARAIEAVNGVPLENVPGGDSKLQGVARRENLLGLFQLQMIVKLFDKYGEMLERSEASFNNALESEEPLKNS